MQYITYSEKETKKLAERFAKNLQGNIVALIGELGAGKTIFVQGFAKGLGIKEKIISPTFVLIRQHKIPNSGSILYHVDLYRLDENQTSKDLGLEEFWSNPDNLVVIEWAEKLKKLPSRTIIVSISKQEAAKRSIIIHNS